MPILFFLAGMFAMYLFNLNWIKEKQNKMNLLIDDFRQTYELQEQLKINYSKAYSELVTCTVENATTCNYFEVNTKLEKIKKERDLLNKKLEGLNKQTESLIKKL